jgi:hypothetical protein
MADTQNTSQSSLITNRIGRVFDSVKAQIQFKHGLTFGLSSMARATKLEPARKKSTATPNCRKILIFSFHKEKINANILDKRGNNWPALHINSNIGPIPLT